MTTSGGSVPMFRHSTKATLTVFMRTRIRHAVTASSAPAVPPRPVKRWTRTRKMEVVMRMIRGESVEALSRELGVEVYRLEEWREMALAGMEGGLRAKKKDALEVRLDEAHKAYGKAMMDNELLRERCRRLGIPFPPKRSK